MTPPVMLITIASMRNCMRMSIPRAPIDIRRPISFVLSVTETYMIFMIPMPPTNSEIPAMAASNTVSNWLVELKVLINSAWVRTVKSSGSLLPSLWDERSIWLNSWVAGSELCASAADA